MDSSAWFENLPVVGRQPAGAAAAKPREMGKPTALASLLHHAPA